MNFVSIILLLFSNLLYFNVIGQVKLGLEDCFMLLEEKNKLHLINKVNEQIEEQRYFQEKDKIIPALNFTTYNGLLTGRSINPTTNLFENNIMFYQNLGLQSYYPLIDWGRSKNLRKQNKIIFESVRYRTQSNLLENKVKVVMLYYDILKFQNNISASNSTKHYLKRLLEISDSLVHIQKETKITAKELKSKLLSDSINMLNYEREILIKKLDLVKLLGLPLETDFELVNSNLSSSLYSFGESGFEKIFERSSSVLEQKKIIESLKIALKMIQKSNMPVANFNIGVSSNYSKQFNTRNDGYLKKLYNNLGGNVAVQISIPIFDQNQRRNQTTIAKHEISKQKLQLEVLKDDLYTVTFTMYNNLKHLKKELLIKEANLKELNEILDLKKELFSLQKINTRDFLESVNLLNMNELDVNSTKASIACYEQILKIYLNDYQ